jgi:hypothetical protein
LEVRKGLEANERFERASLGTFFRKRFGRGLEGTENERLIHGRFLLL